MKVFISVLVLIFSLQSWIKADDIREFEIESMSVGDSLLNYFTEKEIKLFINSPNSMAYKDNKYVAVTTHASYDRFSTPPDNDPYADTKDNYDYVGVIFRPTDKEYIIYEVSAYLNFSNDFEGCKNKKDEIVSSISSSFNNIEKETETSPHNYDKSGESISYDTWFYFDNGYVSAHCENWSEKLTRENGWDDKLKVRIISKKFMNFLTNEAYN